MNLIPHTEPKRKFKPEASIVILCAKSMYPLIAICIPASQAPRVRDGVTLEKVVKS
jgi:hypothetical protein